MEWYDYGARFYDPSLARFMAVDPKAEEYNFQSPFVYAANNPISFIDQNGENPSLPEEGYTENIKHTYTYNEDGSHTITSVNTRTEVSYGDDGTMTIGTVTTTTTTDVVVTEDGNKTSVDSYSTQSISSNEKTFNINLPHGNIKQVGDTKTNITGKDGTTNLGKNASIDGDHGGYVNDLSGIVQSNPSWSLYQGRPEMNMVNDIANFGGTSVVGAATLAKPVAKFLPGPFKALPYIYGTTYTGVRTYMSYGDHRGKSIGLGMSVRKIKKK